ncbi:MAG: glycoside hydrolase family 78 protein [Bacilli bacterium]|jgi:alpha-L-rhamnosidase|nr:glycoside hydrolase family 78 protein [Bacilli bacterium]
MDFKAKWINPENYVVEPAKRYPASYVRKSFKAEKGKEYSLYAIARGIYACYLNGQRISKSVLTPGPLEEPKLYFYQKYDLSKLIQDEDNELLFVLTDGWHRGSMGNNSIPNEFGTDLALLAQVESENKVVLISDETWEASQDGPIRFSDLMMGETYDARKEKIENWHPVSIFDFTPEELKEEDRNPIVEHERFSGKEIKTLKGERIIDFGQNLAGYVELSFKEGKAGEKIIIELTESLDKEGNFQNLNFQGPKKLTYQKIEYIAKDGDNFYKPVGGYWGFRYARISGGEKIPASAFTAIAIYNDMRFVGDFKCGLKEVNQFFSNAVWSFKSNFVGVPTDCPTREKGGWTGDYQAFIYTAMYLADVYKDSASFIELVGKSQDEQGIIMGAVPAPIKKNFLSGSSGWGDAIAIVPDKLFERYQDPSVMRAAYPYMKKWADFDLKRARKKTHLKNLFNPYHKYLLDHGFHWGEWLEPGADLANDLKNNILKGCPEICTAYLYNTCLIVAKAAELLGKRDEADYYRKAAQGCLKAYRWQFVKNGKLVESTHMCNFVRPLQFNLLEEETAKDAAKRLNDKLIASHYIPNTGFLTTHALLKVLVDYGYVETAYKVFLHKECPGWMYPISKGATSIWENWNGIDENGDLHASLNHYTYGAAVSFLFDSVCGIRLLNGQLTIAPHPYEEMGFAFASYDSPFGKIISSWKFENGKLKIHIEVPIKAKIALPSGEVKEVEKGTYDF